jgi:plasmid rolling circle replication initiator protein Rep
MGQAMVSTYLDEDFYESDILVDTRNGKEVPWAKWKEGSNEIAGSFLRNGDIKKASRMYRCGERYQFNECVGRGCSYKKLTGAYFCKNPLCVTCSGRRSMLNARQTLKIFKALQERLEMDMVVLTLTDKRCQGEELTQRIDEMSRAVNLIFKYKEVKEEVLGTVRALEVTYDPEEYITGDMFYGNKKRHMKSRARYYMEKGLKVGDANPTYDTYNPHYHIIVGVPKGYFRSKGYIKQKRWSELWTKALQRDYNVVTHVSAVKRKDNDIISKTVKMNGETVYLTTLNGAIREVMKYCFKPGNVINKDKVKQDRCVRFLAGGLHNRKRIEYTGIFRSIKKELFGEKDVEDDNADLIGEGDEKGNVCPKCGSVLEEALYKWDRSIKEYRRVDLKGLRVYIGYYQRE